jgi:hypothetical protein
MTVDDDDGPPEIDTSRPHPARVYDFLLGGKDNFAADRAVAERLLQAWPQARQTARENRAFIRRAVRYVAGEGVTQFLDIGSGLPVTGNVHEVAQDIDPSARIVYVDNDPIVLAHGQALLVSSPEGMCSYIQADLREPEGILSHPGLAKTLDFGQPVGLILAAVLHFVRKEEKPARIVRTLVDALPSGSYVIASHSTGEYSQGAGEGLAAIRLGTGITGQERASDEFADLVFPGLRLVPPGVVPVSEWRPEPGAVVPARSEVGLNGAVGRKP